MSIPEEAYYNAFNLVPQIGPIRIKAIKSHFESMEKAWKTVPGDFLKLKMEEKIKIKILKEKERIDPTEEWRKIEKENIKILTKEKDTYPQNLKEIHNSPEILYLKGNINKDDFNIAIVGSRKVSEYGKRITEDFSSFLSKYSTIVSGMAYGVDFIAQNECIKKQKRTVAVLGNGLDEKSIYPYANRKLAKEIEKIGCIISEYPIGTPPLRQNFPARNRIISGISKGVLVVEASLSSGSLITAKFALEQNREIFSIPGNIYSKNSEGTNNLIKMGAKLVTKPEEILEEFNITLENKKEEKLALNEEERIIITNLKKDEAIHIDNLSKLTNIKTAPLSSILTIMEIKGLVQNMGGMRYIKK